MLTHRLQSIKNDIQAKGTKSPTEIELLNVLDTMDILENQIATSVQKTFPPSTQMFEMIVKPTGNVCSACGRTLK